MPHHIHRNTTKINSRPLIRHNGGPKAVYSAETNKQTNKESNIPQNYLSEIKAKYRHSQINKNLESIASRLTG